MTLASVVLPAAAAHLLSSRCWCWGGAKGSAPFQRTKLGRLQAWGTSSPVLSSSVHMNTACGCDHGAVGALLAGKAAEQLYWLQNSARVHCPR